MGVCAMRGPGVYRLSARSAAARSFRGALASPAMYTRRCGTSAWRCAGVEKCVVSASAYSTASTPRRHSLASLLRTARTTSRKVASRAVVALSSSSLRPVGSGGRPRLQRLGWAELAEEATDVQVKAAASGCGRRGAGQAALGVASTVQHPAAHLALKLQQRDVAVAIGVDAVQQLAQLVVVAVSVEDAEHATNLLADLRRELVHGSQVALDARLTAWAWPRYAMGAQAAAQARRGRRSSGRRPLNSSTDPLFCTRLGSATNLLGFELCYKAAAAANLGSAALEWD
eukprot:scaffold178_cov255-Pinguiococcus_pyrenoidosus.AAC.12